MEQKTIPAPELNKVLEPEFNCDTFDFGKHPDGKSRTWKLQPLVWKHEKHFRAQVMPLLAVTYKPFETLIGTLAQNLYSELTPSVTKSMFEAEQQIDDMLVAAVHAIL